MRNKINSIREIDAFSNCNDERLDYRKRYWFHKWLDGSMALIENEEGEIFKVDQKGNFKFKNLLK